MQKRQQDFKLESSNANQCSDCKAKILWSKYVHKHFYPQFSRVLTNSIVNCQRQLSCPFLLPASLAVMKWTLKAPTVQRILLLYRKKDHLFNICRFPLAFRLEVRYPNVFSILDPNDHNIKLNITVISSPSVVPSVLVPCSAHL